MIRKRPMICIARVGGTNRDSDAEACFEDLGARADIVHFSDLVKASKKLEDYDGLVFPGGFADGDYVRAGAIWGKKIRSSTLNGELAKFAAQGKPILGICNGFQVLVEAGLLPSLKTANELAEPEATLGSNESGRFECRWVNLRKNPKTKCIFVQKLGSTSRFPVAHGEGRFLVASRAILQRISRRNQVVLQYANDKGQPANKDYPENPNGSLLDIAGVCDESGTIFGLMPHPEDAYFGYQLPDWTRTQTMKEHGDGYGIFSSMVDYIQRRKRRTASP
jgi:phosphoribosylformylglycinamidine synthase I